ncbi:hypothetical protein ONS96_013000 [Cadophora gregata f. sp. sojae]|nr:hypothetical protein ONS96_013000 [Cadophora gregata f. sp. sojae]
MIAVQLPTMLWLATLVSVAMAQTSFNMFPVIGAAGLAANIGWTRDCVVAMNATLNCDPTLYRMAGQIDMYYWSQDNLTALCTDSCVSDSSIWVGNVGDACGGQTYNVGGKLAPVDTVALRYVEGITMACLKANNLPFNYTSNSTSNDQSLTGDFLGDPNTGVQTNATTGNPLYDPHDVAPSSNDTLPVLNITDPAYYDQGPAWCYLESQNWIGVDVDEPDCTANPSNVFCTDPSAMTRMANLYYDTTLCSPCFLTVMWYRLNSLFLPDTDYSDYLIAQYQDIQDICQVKMPETIIRALPNYPLAPNTTYLPPGTDPANNSSAPNSNSGTCSGQTLAASSAGCASLSQTYGVTTGDLQAATGSDTCVVSNATCVPRPCTLKQVVAGDSCKSLSTAYTTSALNVSTSLFLSWNPNIIGLCDSLTAGQYICSSPPGGAYTLLPPINGTNADSAGQVRGGQGPVGVVPTTNSTAAAPTQAGISPNCTKFAYASTGDTCFGFTQSFGITLADFTKWNPALGYPDGHNCTTQFWAQYDYCVQVSGGSSSSSTTSKPPTSTSTLPYPTQSGIISTCNKFNNAVTGDTCSAFATSNKITTAQLYLWNPVLGPNGENCATKFQANVDYCVGVSSSSPTTTTSRPPATTTSTKTSLPYPTQSGIIATCNKFKNAVTGDFCSQFATNNGITTAQLYAWNPVLGPNGENCATQFQANVDYCVGVSSSAATSTTKTSSVIPTQSGIAKNCNKIVVAKSGDFCFAFAQNNAITTAQLYAW